MRIKSETQVIEEAEFKTFGCGWAIAVPSLPTEWVKGKTARKHWPSRTRIDAQAKAASIESEKLEKQEAPQLEIGRLKKEADELEVARQINQKTFRP